MSRSGALLRDTRRRHGLDQRTLARRAGTSQTHISRIERGEISPTISSLERLLLAMGERLELVAVPAGGMGTRDFIPDHALERRADLARTSPAERIAAAISLSRTATTIAAAARAAR